VDRLADTRGDYYVELMRDSRGLSPERSDLRGRWYEAVEAPDKEALLFELEMLLKGVVCFGDPRHHPGPRRAGGLDEASFDEELGVLLLAFERIVTLAGALASPDADRINGEAYVVSGPLETVASPLVTEPLAQVTPDEALRVLQTAFSDLAETTSAVASQRGVSYRLFRALAAEAGREVARSAFFNSALSLEFRTEYDHLQHIEVLHLVYGGGPAGAKRSATVAFVALNRLLRYLDAAEAILWSERAPLVFVPLAVTRADGLVLSSFLREEARRWLSSSFEREVMTLSAREILAAAPGLESDFRLLHELGSMMRTVGDQLQLELREAFERHLDPLSATGGDGDLAGRVAGVVEGLRQFVRRTVVRLAQVFRADLDGLRIFGTLADDRAAAERLRRDMWIFSQIIRGFLAKAAAAPEAANRWTAQSSYQFVPEFIGYFRDLGYHLLRSSKYARFTEFMDQIEGLSATPVHDQDTIEAFVRECASFRSHLDAAFETMSASLVLQGTPFDKRAAAETLRLYLDRS
jgi:hypothetical protein